MGRGLDKLTIRGFKSIERLEDFELGPLNILIGANGAGKSNFVEFFRFLGAIVKGRLQDYIKRNSPADGFFYNGIKHTKRIEIDLVAGQNCHTFHIEANAAGNMLIACEETMYLPEDKMTSLYVGVHEESHLVDTPDAPVPFQGQSANYVLKAAARCQVYHFHDTSATAGMRREGGIEQTERLSPSGENLAAFLLVLREEHPDVYQVIRKTVQRIAPYFDDFKLSVRRVGAEDQVRLTWKQKGTDYIFSPGHFSDGTIRFICLTTALLQPDPPSTIVIDEPELGLHPEALAVLAGLFRSASTRTQIIVATQSPALLSEFDPDQVITVDQVDGASRFSRLDEKDLSVWLEDFSLGELWQKGNVRGGINHV